MPDLLHVVEQAGARLTQAGVSFGQGTLKARDEAAWLVLWALGLPLDALDEHADRLLSDLELQRVEDLLLKRIDERQPLAYLTGEAWLQGVPFHVDRRSIIPRSFIAELLADESIDACLPHPPQRILDLCTGNGSLAVLAAMAWPDAVVDACDLSADALAVARLNVRRHELDGQIRLHQGDLFDALPTLNEPYDLILCNPPYVNAQAMRELPPEFRAEPALALAGGEDGMDLVRRLLAQAGTHLARHGLLVLEVGHEQAHFQAAFPTVEGLWLQTSADIEPVVALTREDLSAAMPPHTET